MSILSRVQSLAVVLPLMGLGACSSSEEAYPGLLHGGASFAIGPNVSALEVGLAGTTPCIIPGQSLSVALDFEPATTRSVGCAVHTQNDTLYTFLYAFEADLDKVQDWRACTAEEQLRAQMASTNGRCKLAPP